MYVMSVPPEKAPDKPEIIEIEFENGDPVAVNGEYMSPGVLFAKLNQIAGRNGIGRIDIVENRFVGMKSRGVYETPGGTILRNAHMAIESITLDREVAHIRDSLIPKYAELIYNGFWFSPEMKMLQTMIDHTQQVVSGTVKMKLYKGNSYILGRKSKNSLYNPDIATFEEDNRAYNQKDAEGFIRLNALRLRIQEMMRRSS
jgi:argininosuccinate synthase